MKTSVDLILSEAAEVVTVAEGVAAEGCSTSAGPLLGAAMDDLGLVSHGAVAIHEGRVLAVGPAADIEARYESQTRLSAEGGTVLPGFCDVHTHPVFAATREGEFDLRARGGTYQDITAAGGGIFSSVRDLRRASRADLATRLSHHLDRFLVSGTTTIEAKSGYGLTEETELLALELLAAAHREHPVDIDPTCLAAHQVPPEYKDDRADYVRLIAERILPEVSRRGLARSADVFCDQGAFTVDEARVVLEAARDCGLARRVHADELAAVGAAELAAEVGAQTADHLVKISDAGLAAMLAAKTTAVLLPGTCFSLRLPEAAPARAMIEAGLSVAIASDFNPGTSYVPSMVAVISLACGLLGMTVAESITAATRNASETLGLPGVRGRLSSGALADLVVLDVPNHLFLGYQVGWNPVSLVIKGGRVVWQRGHQRPALQPAL
ncbi:MAG: imidazolonepropionase [Pseudohongiellaceae bacterium]|jgi:imidazolonepropionase